MSLPTGTVTFLFTDIEGSTRLLQSLGDGFVDALTAHNEILEAAIAEHEGSVVNTEGDAYFAVFADAPNAVAAAVRMTRQLAAYPWADDGEIKVRIGIHTGTGTLGGRDYVGIDVHRAARISAAGHGQQVLLSADTHALVTGDLPEGVDTRDLGLHELKDLPAPEHLHQLVIPGIPDKFPALRTTADPKMKLPPLAVGAATGFLASLSRSRLAALSLLGGTVVGLGIGAASFGGGECDVCIDETAQPATVATAAVVETSTTTTTEPAPEATFSTTTTLAGQTTSSTTPDSDLVGEWDFTVSVTGVDGSVCDGEIGDVYVRTVVITGTDDNLSVDGMDNLEDPDDGPFPGNYEGGVLTFEGSRVEDDGVTHVYFEMTVDGDEMSGFEAWTWDWTAQGETDTCVNGTSTVTATRTG